MDYMFDAYVGYDIGEVDDIPKNAEEVWILAKKYSFDGNLLKMQFIQLSIKNIIKIFRARKNSRGCSNKALVHIS